MTEKLRVIVLDERRLVRESLVLVLQAGRESVDVQEAVDLNGALDRIGKPDSDTVVLMNSRTEEADLTLIAGLRKAAPDVPVVLMTINERPWLIARALQKGARGVVLASSGGAEIFHILRLILAGGTYAPPSAFLSAFPVDGSSVRSARKPDANDLIKLFPELSRKQVKVLNLIARGRSNQEIATEVHMRENAVKAHVHQIMRKLGARNRTEAALLTNQRLYGLRIN